MLAPINSWSNGGEPTARLGGPSLPATIALWHLTGDRTAALDQLRPFEHHLRDAGLGGLSEILEGDAPHLPCGAIAQAWGVAEVLRAWRALE